MNLKPIDKELSRFHCSMYAALKVVGFDNTNFTICTSQAKKKIDRLALQTDKAEQSLQAYTLVINQLQAQNVTLTKNATLLKKRNTKLVINMKSWSSALQKV